MTNPIISQQRTCQNCKSAFVLPLWATRKNAGKYCSRKCYWSFKNNNWIERFWSNVNITNQTNCWIWTAGRFDTGYGAFSRIIDGKKKGLLSHRVAFELTYGAIPAGLILRHKCDNKPCCNPTHLETGTHADNAGDRDKRGRANTARGSRQGAAKLNEDAVLDIRQRYGPRTTQQSLADEYGISRSQISEIVNRNSWKHV